MTQDPHTTPPPVSVHPRLRPVHAPQFFGAQLLFVSDSSRGASTRAELAARGAHVTSAWLADLCDAATRPPTSAFNAAIVDIRRADRTSFSFIERLRQDPWPCAVVVLVGREAAVHVPAAIRSGAEVILSADPSAGALHKAITQAIRKTRQWRQWLQGITPSGGDAFHGRLGATDAPSGFGSPSAMAISDGLKVLVDRANLSKRETQVLRQVILGGSNPKIAAQLQITVRTVKFHVHNLMAKLRAESRGDLLRIYFQGVDTMVERAAPEPLESWASSCP